MDYHDTLSALLPPPREDEPASLRNDIIDELADHLTCAYHRELLRGTDPATAKARTLRRFGDPAAVGRRLWLDAMKGKIMAQRILIATCLVFMAACVWVAGVTARQSAWSTAELVMTNRRIGDLLTQSQATNQEMMRHLQAMDYAAQSRQAMESCKAAFRLSLEIPDGPPATGFDVRLGRGYGTSLRSDAQTGVSDERGMADFELGTPGDWEYTISRVCGDATARTQGVASAGAGGMMAMMSSMGGPTGELTWKTRGTIKVAQGGSAVTQITCPKLPPETSPVKLRVDWPADLADQNLCVEAQFVYGGLNLDTRAPWRVENLGKPNFYQTRDFLCGPGLKVSAIDDAPDKLNLWRFVDGKSSSTTQRFEGILAPNPVFADILSEILLSGSNGMELDEGGYRLARLIVLRPRPHPSDTFKGQRFDLIAHAESVSSFAPPVYQCDEFPDDANKPIMGGNNELEADKKIGRVLLPPAYWREVENTAEGPRRLYQVKPGTVNLWTIPLPEELTNAIRDRLNLKEPAKAK